MAINLSQIGNAIGEAVQSIGTYSAQAAAQANAISRQAQSAQGAFNQASANQANMINDQSMANQMAFNSAMMSSANEYNTGMWEKAAEWNEKMWEKQAQFNAEQAQIQRDWQTQMANTQYQRAIKDMEGAGLNPILAVTGGGIGTGVPGGATASVGGAQMSSASANMASSGLLGANTASENNFSGQMEQMSSTLALLGAVFSGLSSAEAAMGNLGEVGESLGETVAQSFDPNSEKNIIKQGKNFWENAADDLIEDLKDGYNWIKNKITGKDELHIKGKSYESQFLRQNDINKSWNKYSKPKG